MPFRVVRDVSDVDMAVFIPRGYVVDPKSHLRGSQSVDEGIGARIVGVDSPTIAKLTVFVDIHVFQFDGIEYFFLMIS